MYVLCRSDESHCVPPHTCAQRDISWRYFGGKNEIRWADFRNSTRFALVLDRWCVGIFFFYVRFERTGIITKSISKRNSRNHHYLLKRSTIKIRYTAFCVNRLNSFFLEYYWDTISYKLFVLFLNYVS